MSTRSLFSPNGALASAKKIFSPSKSRRNTASCGKKTMEPEVDVVQLQSELSDLRQRVKLLDSETGRNELLDRLKERETENQRAEQQLRSLNDKFHQVQKGLVQIDEERQKLRQAKDQLEKDKKDIQRQLDIREKEVLLLAKRCSSQEEKMKERAKLRASNNELAGEMEGLRSNLTHREEELSQIDALAHELKACQDSRQDLLKRLSKLKKDHDEVAETLNSCFENIQKMEEEKAELVEERRREVQRAHIEMEKHKFAHLKAMNELRAEVQLKQDRIEQMERILKDNVTTCTTLRKEKAEWNCVLQQEICKLKEEQAAERVEMCNENDAVLQTLHEEYAKMLDELRKKLVEKDDVVSSLENEVSMCMQKMMGLATDLHTIQEERHDNGATHNESIEKLEKERHVSEELLRDRDWEIAKLSKSVSALESEKTSLLSELSKLRERVKELEEENAFIMDLEDQFHQVNRSVIEVQEQRYLDAEENGMTIALLQQELDDGRDMWASMEQGLQERIALLEEENRLAQKSSESALSDAHSKLSSLSENALRVSLDELDSERQMRISLEKEVALLKRTLSERHVSNAKANIEMLEGELEEARETAEYTRCSYEERIAILKMEYENAHKLHKTEIESSKQSLDVKEQALSSVQVKLKELRESYKQEVAILEKGLTKEQTEVAILRSQLTDARRALGKEATERQRILSEKDATIASITQEADSLKVACRERERVMREAEVQHEDDLGKAREELQILRSDYQRDMAEKEKELVALAAELQTEIATGKQRSTEHASFLESRETDLNAIRTTAEAETALNYNSLAAKTEEIKSLQRELDELRNVSHAKATSTSEALRLKGEELSSLLDKLKATDRIAISLKDALTRKEEKIASLEVDLRATRCLSEQIDKERKKDINAKDKSLASLKKKLLRSEEGLKERDNAFTSLQATLSEAQKTLERHLVESNEVLSNREKSIVALKVELEQARSDLTHHRGLSEDASQGKDAIIQSLRDEMEVLRDALAEERRTSIAALHVNEESVASLQAELGQLRLASERDSTALRLEVTENDEAIRVLKTELDDLGRTRLSDLSIHEKRIAAKDQIISRLNDDLDELRVRTDDDAKTFREQNARLKIELQKMSTDLAIKEDEIRDLKLIELRDAEETIASLENKLALVRRDSSQRDVETAGVIVSLQGQLTEQKVINAHVEKRLEEVKRQHNKSLETLADELATLEAAKEDLESEVKEQSATLQERYSMISVLTRKGTLLEQRERTLQAQLDGAAEDLRRSKEEHEKTLAALDREISHHRTSREEDDMHFQRRCSSLQKELSDAESRFSVQKERLTEVEQILEDRTKLLGDMVSHNKETEDEKEKALARVIELQEAIEGIEIENEVIRQELGQLRDLQQKREDQLLATIHDERHLREIAEADLEELQSRLRSSRRDSKDVDELEKENVALKDKVRRQEDYLKRKLKKDKVLRERKTRNVVATPSRIASPTKRRKIPVPSTIGGSTTKALSETSSFPDEWDAHSSSL